ncbi:heterokaryon incompatibility protein-domain-containing protein [Clohesyomyces aquaticus]|uniref:Heterokaryon incompatibility protein-domain-containing protein n=1 Tax=Clohesyomyces aquaticus TaxID=1231657 RepID=A0A1Y1YGR8_9PLEO|nr:heterokaryon incompatibility protein-domain-containing protein [Clohesyomyces aquaticus]
MERCTLCNDLEKKDVDDVRLGFDFTPYQLIQSSSSQRCVWCSVILGGLRQFSAQDWSFENDVRRVYVRCCTPLQNMYRSSLIAEVFFQNDRPKVEVEIYRPGATGWRAILPRPSISGHPLSLQGLSWVYTLLEICSKSHALCQSTALPQLPKRVLKIGCREDGTLTIRLFEPREEYEKYAALSHCWGKEQICTTTTLNYAKHLNDIPWSMIPKTFRDAISYVSKLSIQYVWIDSLCIVQDNAEDWDVESSKMADVYSNAYLTLAATSSPGGSQGCFTEEHRPFDNSGIDYSEDEGTKLRQFAIRKPLKHWHNLPPRLQIEPFPLLSRAWVFQERLLSPRFLHFCEEELVWECRQLSICECGNISSDSSPSKDYYVTLRESEKAQALVSITQASLSRLLAPQLQQDENEEDEDLELALALKMSLQQEDKESPEVVGDSKGRDASDPTPELGHHHDTLPVAIKAKEKLSPIARHFHRLVEQYSALRLTKASDILPALSGISQKMSHLRGDFLAGLWADSIGFDLLWRVENLSLRDPSPSRARSPSWSWIAAEGAVAYWDNIMNFEASETGSKDIAARWCREQGLQPLGWNLQSIKACVQVKGKNPYGEVASALLEVEGSAATATLRYSRDQPFKYLLHRHGQIPFFADYFLMAPGQHMIPEKTELTLLLVHPEVSLVLKETFVPVIGRAWERVGIARLSEDMLRLWKVHWMFGAQVEKFTII